MLYVFQVDTGTMKTFNMNLALETVSCLQNEIAAACRVPESDQVLLISGGESLDPDVRVCTYNAGTDTNPIFFFNKSAIESSLPSPPVSEISRDNEVMEMVKNVMDLPVSYSTVISRTEVTNKCYNAAIDIQRTCEQLCHEQHLQQQSWAAVVANLDDITRAFQTRSDIFTKNFNTYLTSRESNIKLLQQFSQDLSLLSKIPVLPALIENSTDLSTSQMHDSDSYSLLQWISSKDNQSSLEQVAEHCRRGLDQFDVKTYESLQSKIKESLETAENNDVKEIKGLQVRLYKLDEFMHEAKEIVKRQAGIMHSFAKNCKSASEMKEDSVLPDLCATHREQLQIIVKHHQQLRDIQNRCHLAKAELTANMHTRLKWIMFFEVNIRDIDNRLVIYHENLKRLRCHLDIIYQIHLAPHVYFELLSEVVLRRKFSQSFICWANTLAGRSKEMLDKELHRRHTINQRVGSHFLMSLFPGLEDLPPSFASERPVPFDQKLPKINESDLSELQTAFPEHKSQLDVPQAIVMPTNDSPSSAKPGPSTSQAPANVSTECYISTSDRTAWTYSTSPPEPAPNYQTTDKISGDGIKDDFENVSSESPGTGLTSFEDASASPELDESMPSSYTDSSSNTTGSKQQSKGKAKLRQLHKQLDDSNHKINLLQEQIAAKDAHLKTVVEAFNLKVQKTADISLKLKSDLESLKNSVVSDTSDFSKHCDHITLQIYNATSKYLSSLESEKAESIENIKKEFEGDKEKIVDELRQKASSAQADLLAKHNVELELNKQINDLNEKLSSVKNELCHTKDQFEIQREELSKKITLEFEVEMENLRQVTSKQLQQNSDETQHLKNNMEKEIVKYKDELESMKKEFEAEKTKVSDEVQVKMRQQHQQLIQTLTEEHESKLSSKIEELKTTQQSLIELQDKIAKDSQEFDEVKQSMEIEKVKALDELTKTCESSRDQALAQLCEQMESKHKNEIESLRSRFKMAVSTTNAMEKSVSDSSLEKYESFKEGYDMNEFTKIIAQMKDDFENEKAQIVADTTAQVEAKYLAKIQEMEKKLCSNPMRTSMMAEQQVIFNEAVNKVTVEKDQIIKELRLKVNKMSRMIEHGQLANLPEHSVQSQPSSLERHGARPKMSESMTGSVMMIESVANLDEPKDMQIPDTIHELRTKLHFKQEQLDVMRNKFMELSVSSSTESLIHSDKVSVLSCNVGEVVLMFFDEKYNNYGVFLLSPVLHFLHSDCYEALGLDPTLKTRKMWALAEVTDKEYCQARKPHNRFKVEVGCKFYRVKAVPWSKELTLRKEHKLRSTPSTSLSAAKSSLL